MRKHRDNIHHTPKTVCPVVLNHQPAAYISALLKSLAKKNQIIKKANHGNQKCLCPYSFFITPPFLQEYVSVSIIHADRKKQCYSGDRLKYRRVTMKCLILCSACIAFLYTPLQVSAEVSVICNALPEYVPSSVHEAMRSVVTILRKKHSKWGKEETDAIGSGFIFSHKKFIITNAHVVYKEHPHTYEVMFSDCTTKKATVVFRGEWKNDAAVPDIAVLRVEHTFPSLLPVPDISDVKKDEKVYLLGTPHGVTNIAFHGHVDSLLVWAKSRAPFPYFSANLMILHGNSGGPLVNKKGEVIGVASIQRIAVGPKSTPPFAPQYAAYSIHINVIIKLLKYRGLL